VALDFQSALGERPPLMNTLEPVAVQVIKRPPKAGHRPALVCLAGGVN
jgi:hypothetical protein